MNDILAPSGKEREPLRIYNAYYKYHQALTLIWDCQCPKITPVEVRVYEV